MVKGRNKGITKPTSPRRRNHMLRAINLRRHITNHTLIQVDSNTNLLDKVILTEVVPRPTKKTKECRLTQINIEENWQQEESTPRKQEI